MSGELRVDGLAVRLGGKDVLRGVGFAAARGDFVGVIGPNGAGKSTLLRAVLGAIPFSGQVAIDGVPLGLLDRRSIARRLAFVPQAAEAPDGISVEEAVFLGRLPHLGRFQPPGDADRIAIDRALTDCDLLDFRWRRADELSGGELQRVFLARAFAQDAPILLLDEPITNLDPRHEWATLERLQRRARTKPCTVVAVLHDLDLVGRFCNRVLALHRGRALTFGTPGETLTPGILAELYGVAATCSPTAAGGVRVALEGITPAKPKPGS